MLPSVQEQKGASTANGRQRSCADYQHRPRERSGNDCSGVTEAHHAIMHRKAHLSARDVLSSTLSRLLASRVSAMMKACM
mmetsp:Transcript_50526/g.163106  ORF Transcript_50526/g.163106 Transcript_50526/m.163106 type:complete len:80 (+) Transcript_50526:97-336(+)